VSVSTATVGAGSNTAPSITTTGDTNTGIFFPAADTIAFSEGGVEAMRLDSAGNMGLGVTPSAWSGSVPRAIQVGTGSYLATNTDGTLQLGTNGFYNGSNFIYTLTGFAGRYAFSTTNGSHSWLNAASGTAGNTISFTQAMTLDASGNLGVNNTSPTTLITSIGGGGGKGMVLSGQVPVLYFEDTNGTDASIFVENGDIAFVNGTTEAARFSSGNLLVGTTSTGFTNGMSLTFEKAQGYSIINHANGTGSGQGYINFGYNVGGIGSITQNGTTGVLYNIMSDYRMKNDQQPLTGAKEFVMALQPKKWQWWDGSGEGVGFIAHEFMEVAKYSGQGTKDAVDAEGKPVYQSIQPSSSEVMANLVAFIQEQQAIIQTLTDRITALEQA
jgi:hypothetical protein